MEVKCYARCGGSKLLSHVPLIAAVAGLVLFADTSLHAQVANEEDEQLFSELDLTEDGFLSGKEAATVKQYDSNGNGKITQAEFLAGRKRDRGGQPAQEDEQAFHELDINEDGRLSGSELNTVSNYDLDGDRRVTKVEFLTGRVNDREKPKAVETKPQRPKLDAKIEAWNRKLEGQFETGNKWAILIGINQYEKGSKLQFCVADTRLLNESLVKNCGYRQTRILMLTDDQQDPELHPTKSNLQRQIANRLKEVQANDSLLVYYTGHGDSFDGQSYLEPMDFDPAHPKLSAWRTDELRSLLQNCLAAQKLLVLDSCRSGGATAVASAGQSGQELATAFEHAQGLITLASCRTTEYSLENPEIQHGLFTYAFCRALQGAADFDQNGIVDTDELYRHVLVEVPIAADQQIPGHKQTPVRIMGEDVVGVFAVARPNGPVPEEKGRPKLGDTFVNSIGMKLAFIPPGTFIMGSDKNEHTRTDDEGQHPVSVSLLFHMGVYEVTQEEYLAVMGQNPSYFSAQGGGSRLVKTDDTASFPVEQVTWEDAVEFCLRLSQLQAEQDAGRTYRLPTEAEWEYVCRANTTTPFNTGELISFVQANVRGDRPFLDAPEGPYLGRTLEVGSYKPNAFGLYDMHGNVAEWCLDWYENNTSIVKQFEVVNPTGPLEGDRRVVRGGTYSGDVGLSRSATRIKADPEYRFKGYGFRVVCIVRPNR